MSKMIHHVNLLIMQSQTLERRDAAWEMVINETIASGIFPFAENLTAKLHEILSPDPNLSACPKNWRESTKDQWKKRWKRLWAAFAPTRYKIFIWRILREGLYTLDDANRIHDSDPRCMRCAKNYREDCRHLFWDCPANKRIVE